jgi:hypothetical protein
VPRRLDQLRSLGVMISKRQRVRLLIAGQDRFCAEARAVRQAGLETAAWISVDDTGARHRAQNGVCTQIGNALSPGLAPPPRRAGSTSSRSCGPAMPMTGSTPRRWPTCASARCPSTRSRLAEHPRTHFADAPAWTRHLRRLGFHKLQHSLDPVRLATEGAVWGAIEAHDLFPDTVIVSDDAGHFEVGRHALCWVHAERLVPKSDTFTAEPRRAQQPVRGLIWWFDRDLKADCRDPTARRKAELKARFDRILGRRTGFAMLDCLLQRLHANKTELLRVLERPEIPLHTNGSENDLHAQVTRRKISGGTRSDAGQDRRDAFLGLRKTCQKLGLSFWADLGVRLGVADAPAIPCLPDMVRACGTPA